MGAESRSMYPHTQHVPSGINAKKNETSHEQEISWLMSLPTYQNLLCGQLYSNNHIVVPKIVQGQNFLKTSKLHQVFPQPFMISFFLPEIVIIIFPTFTQIP